MFKCLTILLLKRRGTGVSGRMREGKTESAHGESSKGPEGFWQPAHTGRSQGQTHWPLASWLPNFKMGVTTSSVLMTSLLQAMSQWTKPRMKWLFKRLSSYCCSMSNSKIIFLSEAPNYHPGPNQGKFLNASPAVFAELETPGKCFLRNAMPWLQNLLNLT